MLGTNSNGISLSGPLIALQALVEPQIFSLPSQPEILEGSCLIFINHWAREYDLHNDQMSPLMQKMLLPRWKAMRMRSQPLLFPLLGIQPDDPYRQVMVNFQNMYYRPIIELVITKLCQSRNGPAKLPEQIVAGLKFQCKKAMIFYTHEILLCSSRMLQPCMSSKQCIISHRIHGTKIDLDFLEHIPSVLYNSNLVLIDHLCLSYALHCG